VCVRVSVCERDRAWFQQRPMLPMLTGGYQARVEARNAI